MKVEFYFPVNPITGYDKNDEVQEINKKIKEKVHNKIIEITCVPTKEMEVDISSFSEVFGFSKEEMEWINDFNEHHYIRYIFIKPTHLELWLEFESRDGEI